MVSPRSNIAVLNDASTSSSSLKATPPTVEIGSRVGRSSEKHVEVDRPVADGHAANSVFAD